MTDQSKITKDDAKKSAESAHFFAFTAEKAGMAQVDQSKANQVIYEMSKDSRYFKNAQRNDTSTQKRIKEMQHKASLLTENQFKAAKYRVDSQVDTLIKERNWNNTWVVVDMDMFFAAVEIRDRPELKGKPVAVGGMSMISTANYEARKYGVRSAMPGFIARQLCPDLVFVSSNFEKYKEVAQQTREVFAMFDPSFSPASLDEAYLNITQYLKDRPEITAKQAVNHLRAMIRKRTRLTCSAGIAPLPMLAKICSDVNKPNGQFWLEYEPKQGDTMNNSVIQFLHDLKVRKVPGIGKVTEKLLGDGLGIQTVGDLWANRYKLPSLFTSKTSSFFLRVCVGATSSEKDSFFAFGNESANKSDVQRAGQGSLALAFQMTRSGAKPPQGVSNEPQEVESKSSRKSISQERTFRDCSDPNWLSAKLYDICKSLSEGVCETQGLLGGHTITLKLKAANFRVRSKAVTLANCVGRDVDKLYQHALPILRSELPICLRLLGVRLSALEFGAASQSGKGDASIGGGDVLKQTWIDQFLKNPNRNDSGGTESLFAGSQSSKSASHKDGVQKGIEHRNSNLYNRESKGDTTCKVELQPGSSTETFRSNDRNNHNACEVVMFSDDEEDVCILETKQVDRQTVTHLKECATTPKKVKVPKKRVAPSNTSIEISDEKCGVTSKKAKVTVTSDMNSKVIESRYTTKVDCPICGHRFTCDTIDAHVDKCIDSSMKRREALLENSEKNDKRRNLTKYFRPTIDLV